MRRRRTAEKEKRKKKNTEETRAEQHRHGSINQGEGQRVNKKEGS
jgi:hypothetical protein